MRVKRSGESITGGGKSSVGGSGKTKLESLTFASTIRESSRNILDGELTEMLAEVRRLGEVFMKSPDEDSLDIYKDAIKQYLTRISREIFSVRQESGAAQEGRRKIYQLVEVVRSDLDSLTRETLQKDKALSLLASLDDIRGLVLDLLG